jgi:hypothetical protein
MKSRQDGRSVTPAQKPFFKTEQLGRFSPLPLGPSDFCNKIGHFRPVALQKVGQCPRHISEAS